MARTTFDLDEELIAKGMAVSGARSKKALIEAAVEELIRSRARQELFGAHPQWRGYGRRYEPR
ncbi:MAG: type II toxin-antitoxin system VapB family antitoxin [Dehalococcoidia bacterium]